MDASTLNRKVLFGYQGWFLCPGDGSPFNDWRHWFSEPFSFARFLTVDNWPDVSELTQQELCVTRMTLPNGEPATLFSSYRGPTVMRHFKWMQQYGIDGVFLQRFSSHLSHTRLAVVDKVAQNVRAGAEAHGRVFAIMYDISGGFEMDRIVRDWTHLVDDLRLTESPWYLRDNGRPVLGIWGMGFHGGATAAQALALVDYLRTTAPERYRVTLVGGVPTYWRSLTGDSQADPLWAQVYRSFDVLSPWTVGRYSDNYSADSFRYGVLVPDMQEISRSGIGYMPVVFPGFSWYNLYRATLNQIPRNGGHFLWRQVYNALASGATTLYVAMFDETDEGTAMFKLAPTAKELPVEARLVPLDIDGYDLPSDWYLRLGGAATRMMRGEIPLTPDIPISPLVRIDVKPGSASNSIRLGSRGTLPVAIFGSEEFDATNVDLDTLLLSGSRPELRGDGSPMASVEDVDGDGILDLVVHFRGEELVVEERREKVVLTGYTLEGLNVRGVDYVTVVPPGDRDVFPESSGVLAKFEFNGNVRDSSGNRRDGILLGGEFIPSEFGQGLHVFLKIDEGTGTVAPMGIEWSAFSSLFVHPYTIEVVLTPKTTDCWGKLYSWNDDSDDGWYYCDDGVQDWPYPVLGEGLMRPGTSHYLAIVSTSPDHADLYFQGRWVGSTTTSAPAPPPQLILFRDDSVTDRYEQLDAVVEALRISGTTRTADEIAEIQVRLNSP